MKTIRIPGRVSDESIFIPDNPENYEDALRLNVGHKVIVTIGRPSKSRTLPQNNYLFGVVYKEIALETGSTVEDVHEAMKNMFLSDHATPIPHIKSTTKLTTVEFNEYFESIIQWASSFLGLYIELPNESAMWGGL
jgi:hypothetical protein